MAKVEAEGGDDRERLLDTLEMMGARLRAAPGFVEPTPAELTQSMQDLDAWFRDHGYGR